MLVIIIFAVILFILLIPGFLLRIPKKGSFLTVSIVHSIIFAILFYVIYKIYSRYNNTEKFRQTQNTTVLGEKIFELDKNQNNAIIDVYGKYLAKNMKKDSRGQQFPWYKQRIMTTTIDGNLTNTQYLNYIPIYQVNSKICNKCGVDKVYTDVPPTNCTRYKNNICYKY
jgi:hypothetical protein